MRRYKKIIITVILSVFVFIVLLFKIGQVTGAGIDEFTPRDTFNSLKDFMSPVNFLAQKTVVVSDMPAAKRNIWDKIQDALKKVNSTVGEELANRTVEMFINDLAYQVANELATGGPGGKPQFRIKSIQKTLQNAQDAALGDFIGQLSETYFSDLGLNLCEPSLSIKLTLTLSLIDAEAPPQKTPKCNWREVQKRWANYAEYNNNNAALLQVQLSPQAGAKGINDYFEAFSLEQSDLGVFAVLSGEINQRKLASVTVLELKASECQGFLDKTTTITEEVKTHCRTILNLNAEQWESAVRDSAARIAARKEGASNPKLTAILRDAAVNFTNTLTSKLLKNWIKGGMWSAFGKSEDKNLRDNLLAQLRGGGDIRQPRNGDIFSDFKSIKITPIDSYSFINDFSVCPEEIPFRKPDNCVMSTDLLQAANNKMTIKEAVDAGALNGAWQFINPADNIKSNQECYKSAFCYQNLVKMRKANIISVGWEMASQRSDLVTPVTLRQALDCFEDDNCQFVVSPDYAVDGVNHNPFYHLIDPNWVLKVPPAYCAAYVYAPLLESPDSDTRQQYCADTQVCLREDDNGNCLDNQYGYCTQSENIWRLGGDACESGEIYSGCLAFDNPATGLQSYLEQTLSYCSADQAGCKRYSQEMNAENNWILQDINSDDNDLFLNRQAKDCPSSESDCHEYIVMAADRGINLIPNGGLDPLPTDNTYPAGWVGVDLTTPSNGVLYDSATGKLANGYTYGASGAGGYLAPDGITVLSERVQQKINLLPNTTYILSASAAQDINNANASSTARVSLIMCDQGGDCSDTSTSTNLAGSVASGTTCFLPTAKQDTDLRFVPSGVGMERSSCSFTTNQYTYGALLNLLSNTTGQNLIWFDDIKLEIVSSPAAIASPYTAYGSGGTITMNETRFMCTAEELGCQGYTPTTGGPMIPAVVSSSDICPAECVGYSSFAETPSIFSVLEGDSEIRYYNFIPKSADSCPVTAVGCEEFTNLDEVAQGGEGKEYFSYIRQCVPENLGVTYYTWEGSDTAGYQIRTWQILANNTSGAPCTNIDPNGTTCLDDVDANHAAAVCSDAATNSNCRQFFNTNAQPFYRLQDRVIFASSDCHEYRRALSGSVYKAIPSISTACSAQYNGCHLYTGNTANNVREIFANNFEQGTYAPWSGGAGSIDLSAESLENNGHSLKLSANSGAANMRRPLANIVRAPKQYQLTWWMKNDVIINNLNLQTFTLDGNTPAHITALNDTNDSQFKNIAPGNWQYFSLVYNLDTTNYNTDNLHLSFNIEGQTVDFNVYIDNIILKEVSDNIAVVRNSWETPVACDSPYVGYHLGCQNYTDTNNQSFNLKSFSNLCRVEAIGCTAVIDTHNSTYPFAATFNAGNNAEITVAADNIDYLVPDSNKYCANEYKGCQALGLPDRNNPYLLNTVYKINNPDQYASSLCSSDGLGCEEYASDKGVYYFRDPGSATCTYQSNIEVGGGTYSGWFKTSTLGTNNILGCSDGNGTFNLQDLELNECVWATAPDASGTDLTGYFRKNSLLTTSPVGCWSDEDGVLEASEIINDNLAAQCPEEKNLCTTIKDPSDPEACDPNIDGRVLDGVCYDTSGSILNANSRLACDNLSGSWTPACQDYYYYKNKNIDESSCAGAVDKNGGCVLLYDANDWQASHDQINVSYDSAKTYDNNLIKNQAVSPVVCDPATDGSCSLDANMIVKVQKDRQCSEWLACRSSTAVWDKDANRYKTVCDDVAACVEYDRDNNITKCKKWAPASVGLGALTMQNYQARDTGPNGHLQWSDNEYTGYAIPDMLPVQDLTVNTFPNGSTRIAYAYSDSTAASGARYYSACGTGATAKDGLACNISAPDGVFVGECDNGYCWLNPKINQASTSTLALSTRGYAMSDAPFPHSIYPSGEDNSVLRAYNTANFCQVDNSRTNKPMSTPNGCELSYQKVTFGSANVRYYPMTLGLPKAICSSGDTSRYDCDRNSDCDTFDSNNASRGDGLCERYTKIEIINNWSGICLDYDYNNKIIKDTGADFYCNQWYPAEQIAGTDSLYENYLEAGYYNQSGRDALFCAVSEPYIVPTTRYYCMNSISFGGIWNNQQFCSVIAKVPAGTRVHLSMMDDTYNGISVTNTLLSGYLNVDKIQAYASSTAVSSNGVNFEQGLGIDWLYRKNAQPIFKDVSSWSQHNQDQMSIAEGASNSDDGGSSLLLASDFDSTGALGLNTMSSVPVLPLAKFDEIFDATDLASSGGVELYFYDIQIDRTGSRNASAGVVLANGVPEGNPYPSYDIDSRPNYVYYIYGSNEDGGGGESRGNMPQCQPGFHESYYRTRQNNDTFERYRYCSPMSHGLYIKPALPNAQIDTICTQSNCSAVNGTTSDIKACLATNSVYSGIDTATCSGPTCEYKRCVEGKTTHDENGVQIYWCSDFGSVVSTSVDISYNCFGSGEVIRTYQNIDSISGCLDIIYDIVSATIPNNISVGSGEDRRTCNISGSSNQIYNKMVLTTGVDASLDSSVNNCMTPTNDAGVNCTTSTINEGFPDPPIQARTIRDIVTGLIKPRTTYTPSKVGVVCNGLACYQQCGVVSRLDAKADLSWVRTDLWWRYSKNDNKLVNHTWQSWYHKLNNNIASYTRNTNVYYDGIQGEAQTAFKTHFGAALEYFSTSMPAVVTNVPLKNNLATPAVATFFSSDAWLNADNEMAYIFAKVYNLRWTDTGYTATGADTGDKLIDSLAPADINTFAGRTYTPRALKVCGNDACAVRNAANEIVGYQEGITINGKQGDNLVAKGSVFTSVKSYFYAHPDHMPVANIMVDWDDGNFSSAPGRYKNALPYCNSEVNMPNTCGDSSISSCNPTPPGLQGFGGLDNACRVGYKIFYHDYQYTSDPAHSCAANNVSGQVAGAACFKPEMYVIDRWGQGALAGDAIPYDGWIVVNP